MAPRMLTTWPPENLMWILKLSAVFGCSYTFGLAAHMAFTGPTIIGEIMAGYLIGPSGLDVAENVNELKLVGKLGMLLIVFERGLQTDFSQLRRAPGQGIAFAMMQQIFSMLFVALALKIAKLGLIESVCVGAVMSTMAVGVVDLGWKRQDVGQLLGSNSSSADMLGATSIVNSLLFFTVLAILQIFEEGWWWWAVMQATLFSLAFLAGCFILKTFWANMCCAALPRLFSDGNESALFEGYDVMVVVLVLAFALGLGVVAETVGSTPILGVFVGGCCFSGIKDVRMIYEKQTKNVSHWLSRVFFTCSIGFLMRSDMWTNENLVTNGIKTAAAAMGGKLLVGMCLSTGFLRSTGATSTRIMQLGTSILLPGEFGFVMLHELYSKGIIRDEGKDSALWGLMLNLLIAPLLCHFINSLSTADSEQKLESEERKEPLVMPVPPQLGPVGQTFNQDTPLRPDMVDVGNTLSRPNLQAGYMLNGTGAGKAQEMRLNMNNFQSNYSQINSPAPNGINGSPQGPAHTPDPHSDGAAENGTEAAVPPTVQSQIRRTIPALWND